MIKEKSRKLLCMIMVTLMIISLVGCGKTEKTDEAPSEPEQTVSEPTVKQAAEAYEENLGLDEDEAEEMAEQIWGNYDEENYDYYEEESSKPEDSIDPSLYVLFDNIEGIDHNILSIPLDSENYDEEVVNLYGNPDEYDGDNLYYGDLRINLFFSYDEIFPRITYTMARDDFDNDRFSNLVKESTITFDCIADVFNTPPTNTMPLFTKDYSVVKEFEDISYKTLVETRLKGVNGTFIDSISNNGNIEVIWFISDLPQAFLHAKVAPSGKVLKVQLSPYFNPIDWTINY